MTDSNFLKVLYAIISLMLLSFFGCGIYFVSQSVYGAGLIAIGIGLLGSGVALFLSVGLLFAVDNVTEWSSSKGNAILSNKSCMKNVQYTMNSVCDCSFFQSKSVEVSVCDVGFFVRSDECEPIYIPFSDIMRVAHVDSQFLIMGKLEYRMNVVQEAIVLMVDNKMECKMFEKTLLSENVEIVDSSVAKSVIADITANMKNDSVTSVSSGRHVIKSRKNG